MRDLVQECLRSDDRRPLRLFVGGASRGGTTLGQRLIADLLDLHTLPETQFFANTIGNLESRRFPTTARPMSTLRRSSSRVRQMLGRSTGAAPVNIDGHLSMEGRRWQPVRRVTREFVARLDRDAAGRSGWVEKTPFHSLYAREIDRLVADATIVHVIRDPRETIGSIRDAARTYNDPWGAIYDRVERDVDAWNAAMRSSSRMVGRRRHIFVPFDAVCAAPEAAMGLIAESVGVQRALARGFRAGGAGTCLTLDGAEPWKSQAKVGAVRAPVSKWSSALTPCEQRRAEAMIAPIPAALAAALDSFRGEVAVATAAPAPGVAAE